MNKIFKDKVILITGGTGSFGRSFIREITKKKYSFKKIIIFSRDELKQHDMKQSKDFSEKNFTQLRYFIGDVRDKERLLMSLDEVDYVIHAAALKHVSTGEYNPFEVIKTNVIGSQNLIDAALQKNVKKIIALSTDKAVSPVNLYGASKLCADKIFTSSNNFTGKKNISFSVVRYGNVMGSRGSVLPEFLKQKEKKLIQITDPKMTRFNIFLKDAVEMVLWSLINTIGGEVIIPKIPSFKITDLASVIAPNTKIKIIGIREGEKIHEELLSKSDSQNAYDIKKYYALLNHNDELIRYYKKKFNAKKVKAGFSYSSGENIDFLSKHDLKKLLRKFKI